MKTLTLSINTAKEAIRQPLFIILALVGSLGLLLSAVIPYFTFGEDVKMVKDCGLAFMLLLSLFLALWTASNTISEDIEHRTAITLLSKPLNRRQFLAGKFFGILLGVGLLFLILSIVFSGVILYKVGYDAREGNYKVDDKEQRTSQGTRVTFDERMYEVKQVFPGIILTFMQVMVLTAVSVMVATRLPLVVNAVTCFAVFFLGHLAPVLVQRAEGQFEIIEFIAKMMNVVLPDLEVFNLGPALATGSVIPPEYVAWSFLYSVGFSLICLTFGCLMFEDRDLA